ncbi:unnamed protein product [Mytilus coruscus]|uniref:Endonuclease/exonuclease/phosphatase domain-containing protein n=1 Tax=Mytilus coruscus TaxID=42192 RepID=A0A6J8BD86_MYTCO|nr:unnamed protein product [Mytilus coruscus]
MTDALVALRVRHAFNVRSMVFTEVSKEIPTCVALLTGTIGSLYKKISGSQVGDLNGTLLNSRQNQHDRILKEFVKDYNLHQLDTNDHLHSFFHHNGKSTSKIDYILSSNSNLIHSIQTFSQDAINLSAHVPVKALLTFQADKQKLKKSSNFSNEVLLKTEWEKCVPAIYIEAVKKSLDQNKNRKVTTEDQTTNLIDAIKQAARKTIPTKTLKIRGPRLKVSQHAKKLLTISKQKHRIWDLHGRKRGEDTCFLELKEAKRNVRKRLRQERAAECKEFYKKLESKPNSKNFYRLIRRNTNSTKELATTILYDDHELTDPEEQREAMAKYFQNLATPKDDPDFDENFLNNCQFRCEIIKEICS